MSATGDTPTIGVKRPGRPRGSTSKKVKLTPGLNSQPTPSASTAMGGAQGPPNYPSAMGYPSSAAVPSSDSPNVVGTPVPGATPSETDPTVIGSGTPSTPTRPITATPTASPQSGAAAISSLPDHRVSTEQAAFDEVETRRILTVACSDIKFENKAPAFIKACAAIHIREIIDESMFDCSRSFWLTPSLLVSLISNQPPSCHLMRLSYFPSAPQHSPHVRSSCSQSMGPRRSHPPTTCG